MWTVNKGGMMTAEAQAQTVTGRDYAWASRPWSPRSSSTRFRSRARSLTGSPARLVRNGPARYEVGEKRMPALVRRPRDAAPLQLRRRLGLLRQPLPAHQGVPRGREGADLLPRVRHRPLPLDLQTGGDDVPAGLHRQLQRQPRPPRRRVHRDDRDAAPRRLRPGDPRRARRRLRACRASTPPPIRTHDRETRRAARLRHPLRAALASTGSTRSATAPTSVGSGRTASPSPPTCTASR